MLNLVYISYFAAKSNVLLLLPPPPPPSTSSSLLPPLHNNLFQQPVDVNGFIAGFFNAISKEKLIDSIRFLS